MENDEKIEQGELLQETTTEEVEVVESTPESDKGDDYRGKLNATNRFLEKEGYEFTEGKWIKPSIEKVETPKKETSSNSHVSIKDLHALRDVHEDDIDEVTRFAAFNKVTISQAKKDPIMQAILSDRSEKRTTASATHVGNARRSTNKVSDEVLVSRAEKGDLPDDDEGIARLISAKSGYNRKR